MILISPSLVLIGAAGNYPRLYYHNLVTADVLSSDQAAEGEPASNAANPSTYLKWRGENTTEQSLTVTFDAAKTVDYMAVAGHNFGSASLVVSFQYSDDGITWTDLADATIPADDSALVQEFPSTFKRYFRVHFDGGSEAPAVGVLYLGQKLVLQRKIYVGHTPITLGLKTTVSNGRSESGQFLGRVLRRQALMTQVDMKHVTPAWYRANMTPFVQASRSLPFFFAWRPQSYPREVGYAWLMDDVSVRNDMTNGMMEFSMQMQGHS